MTTKTLIVFHFKYFQVNLFKFDFSLTTYFFMVKKKIKRLNHTKWSYGVRF